jgi:uncharacterized protein involved in type VI secretion and phage assembly
MMTDHRLYGVMIGIVTDVKDPDNQDRVKLKFPWLADDSSTGWVPIARPMAGKKRGFFYMPEVDDEALVAFEQGSVDHPFILGFLHNGVDTPPTDGIDEHVRRLKTVSGHILEFDDSSGKERILLKTQGGHFLEMKDSEKTIEIKTSAGQQILMSDQSPSVAVQTSSGHKVTVSDAGTGVKVESAAGTSIDVSATGITVTSAAMPVTVNCLSATVTCSTTLSVTAPIITLSGSIINLSAAMVNATGMLICTTLSASSVISASYTPGVGNIW